MRFRALRTASFRSRTAARNFSVPPQVCAIRSSIRCSRSCGCAASWTRRGFDTVNGNAQSVYRRLANPLRGGDILLLHDGNAARGGDGTPVILEVLPRLLDALALRDLKPVTLRSALT